MFTHHVNLLHTTYRYDPVHEDIVTHIRHRLLLCQHVGDVAKDDEKNREDCSSDNCKHLVDVNFTKSYHLYTRHQKHQKLSSQQDIFCGIDIFERKPSRLDNMLTHAYLILEKKLTQNCICGEKWQIWGMCSPRRKRGEACQFCPETCTARPTQPRYNIILKKTKRAHPAQPNYKYNTSSKRQSPTDNIILIIVAIFYIWYRRWRR